MTDSTNCFESGIRVGARRHQLWPSTGAWSRPQVRNTSSTLAADIAAVNTHGQWTIGNRQFVPVPLASCDEAGLFLPQFTLHAFRYIPDVPANGEGIQGVVHRQHIVEQLRRHAITHQRRPFGLQEQQFGRGVVRQQLRQRLNVEVSCDPQSH
jgi:hypothetical protein